MMRPVQTALITALAFGPSNPKHQGEHACRRPPTGFRWLSRRRGSSRTLRTPHTPRWW